jgi:hypothetical protein
MYVYMLGKSNDRTAQTDVKLGNVRILTLDY